MFINTLASERATILGRISPISQGAGAVSTGWIDISRFDQLLGIVQVGVLGAAATVDAKFEQATSSGGAGVKDVTGKAITQLTKAGTDDSKEVEVNLRASEVDIKNNFRWVRLTVTVATAASLLSAVVLGFFQRAGMPTDQDLATVDEIVK